MDQALAESEAMIDAHLSQARSHQRRAIEKALCRIQKGDYGVCVACGNRITGARLRAVPWTDLCRDCREQDNGEF
jgi:DnaK suppressor protein